MYNQMLDLSVEIKIDAIKKDYNFKNIQKASIKRKPDLCYDLEYILDRVSIASNS